MKKTVLYPAIIGLLLVGMLVSAVVIFLAYQRPLDTPLAIVEGDKGISPGQSSTAAPSLPDTGAAQTTATEVPTQGGEGACGMTGQLDILIVASDNNWWDEPAGADAIRMARVDFDQQEIFVYAFPRDLLVDTPSYKNYGFDRMRLGPLYYKVLRAEKPNKEAPFKAVNAVAQTIYDNYGVKADYYIDVRGTENLTAIVDEIGKIEINAAKAFLDKRLNVSLDAGVNTLDGKTALLYMRPLDAPEEEWNRITRQNEVLKGLVEKLTEPKTMAAIPTLYTKYEKTVATDLSVKQVVSLACLAEKVDFKNIQLKSVSPNMVTIEPQGVMVVKDPNALKNEIQGFFPN